MSLTVIVLLLLFNINNSQQIYVCPEGKDCVIDCTASTDCTKINGTKASSLKVICNQANIPVCIGLEMYCPIGKTCSLICNNTHSCGSNTKIYYDGIGNAADEGSHISLICNGYYSCYTGHEINAPHASMISTESYNVSSGVTINGQYASNITTYCAKSCTDWIINGEHANNVSIICEDQSCDYHTVNASFAKSLVITATGKYAWNSNNRVYAWNAGKVDITCIGAEYEYSCYQSEFYVPSTGVTLNCYGYGCYYIGDFYIWNGILDIKVNMNSCGLCTNGWCISSNELYCGLYWSSSTSIGYTKSAQYYYGTCNSGNCGCNTYNKAIHDGYYGDMTDKMCPNYTDPTNYDSWKTAIIIGICMGVILILYISKAMWTWCSKSNETRIALIADNQQQPIIIQSINNKKLIVQ